MQLASTMWKLLSTIAILVMLINSYVLNLLADPIYFAHKFCLNFSPVNSDFHLLYSAMVCGADPQFNDFGLDMRNIGLYHLLVVSGSHLIFLEQILNPITSRFGRTGDLCLFFTLILFALGCSLLPPVTRALISFMLRKSSEELKLFWQGHHLALFSGLATLIIFPEWIHSLSFLMSWLASLLVSLPIRSELKKHFAVYFGLFPLFIGLQAQHPLTSVINWLMSPILGLLLFPASLLCFLLKPLTFLIDPLWHALIYIANLLGDYFLLPYSNYYLARPLLWLYLFSLHFMVYKYLVATKRATA